MKLRGQAAGNPEQGYAMAALLVALSVMAVVMTVVMPVWKQMTQREKEAELVFRGQQYTRAIGLFQRKTGPGVLPPNIDVLVDQRFLRRKYKDPITGQDFLLIPGAVAAGAQAQIQAAQSASQSAGRQTAPTTSSASSAGLSGTASSSSPSPYVAQGGPFGTSVPGGVIGVVSKSTSASLRVLNGRGHYNEWEFRYVPPAAPPAGAGGGAGPTGRGQRGQPAGGLGGVGGINGPGRGGSDGGRGDGRGGFPDGRGGGGPGDPTGRGGPAGPPGTGPGPGGFGGRGLTPFGR